MKNDVAKMIRRYGPSNYYKLPTYRLRFLYWNMGSNCPDREKVGELIRFRDLDDAEKAKTESVKEVESMEQARRVNQENRIHPGDLTF